jgi:transcriptional regulator with XRE-family HTH domain
MSKTRNFAEVIRRKLAADPALAAAVEDECFNAHIAEQIHNARVAKGLTQAALAKKIGTAQSAIARLEDAQYDGHSLTILKKIASALQMKLRVELYAKCELKPLIQQSMESKPAEWKGRSWHPTVSVSRPAVSVSRQKGKIG